MIVLFWIFVGFLVYALIPDGTATGTMISAWINPLVAICVWGNARQRTHADAQGLRLVGAVRSRRIRWAEVRDVGTTRARWGEHAIRVDLTDGTTVHPPGVPASAVDELEVMRRRASA